MTVLHDDAGNLTRDKNGYTYHYDYENRLVEIRKTNDTIAIATFEYDALGRRIEKKDMLTQAAKRYYYDDQRIALQTSVSSGGTETDYRYFAYGNYIDEVLVMGSKLGTTWLTFCYAHDHLYSPVALFSISGTVGERYEYDAYGKVTIWDAGFTTIRPVSSTYYVSPFSFTGRELDSFDSNTFKLMYYRARYYDPQTGRFLQRDPLQYVDSSNLYEYVTSSPLKYLDPEGTRVKYDYSFKPASYHDTFDQGYWGKLDGANYYTSVEPTFGVRKEGSCYHAKVARSRTWTVNANAIYIGVGLYKNVNAEWVFDSYFPLRADVFITASWSSYIRTHERAHIMFRKKWSDYYLNSIYEDLSRRIEICSCSKSAAITVVQLMESALAADLESFEISEEYLDHGSLDTWDTGNPSHEIKRGIVYAYATVVQFKELTGKINSISSRSPNAWYLYDIDRKKMDIEILRQMTCRDCK